MQCSICLLEPTKPIQVDCCGNWFCVPCINEWTEIKNTCPLCGALKVQQRSEEDFDNGFMMLENEINQVNARMLDVFGRVLNRSQSSQDHRSSFSRSHIMFLEDQVALTRTYQDIMNEKWFLQDRANTVEAMQMITEHIITIEAALSDRSIGYDYDPFEEEYQEEEDWDILENEDDYESYEVISKKKLNQKGGRKTKGGLIQQQEQPGKKVSSKFIKP